jgi:DNA-binding XRE family transcriptional regulator
MNTPDTDILAGSWTIDPNDELVTLTDDMFQRPDDTPDTETRTVTGLTEMAHADKIYKERLAELRHAAGLTQTEVAHHMGISQSGIAAIESPTDIRISTLARYLDAIGSTAELTITYHDHTTIAIHLNQLVSTTTTPHDSK